MSIINFHNSQKTVNLPDIITNTGNAIKMSNIVKNFKTDAGIVNVLKNISTDFNQGEFVSVVGKSGSGKSTLINMITGIDHPTSGKVNIGGTMIQELDESLMARWRGRNLGIVFQFYQLLPMLSLLENTMLPMDFSDVIPRPEREQRAMELLSMVGLKNQAYKMPSAVSGGQQQVAAIARALANDPPLIVADEPTGNLDSRTAENVMQIFESLVDKGKTVIMVTHDPVLAERTSRSLLLADGEIVHEMIAKTFPMLTHAQMLKATHEMEKYQYAPGSTIIQEGNLLDSLHIITQGKVEIVVEDTPISELSAGEYFGEIEMLQNSPAIATIRNANETPVETVSLNRKFFGQLLSETFALQEAIFRVVQERLAENLSKRHLPRIKRRKYAQTSLA